VKELLSGETVTFEGEFLLLLTSHPGRPARRAAAKVVVRRAQPEDARMAGEVADGVLLNMWTSFLRS
jgi:alkanesulfonate monooxygenase SsuD/methylene tetrahydromethanopterin reductase-like flavin-dependent oxidoreductase (luciferase family)